MKFKNGLRLNLWVAKCHIMVFGFATTSITIARKVLHVLLMMKSIVFLDNYLPKMAITGKRNMSVKCMFDGSRKSARLLNT